MPGKLDEISRAIGELEGSSKSLQRTFEQHCIDDDRRHNENITAIRDLTAALTKTSEVLLPLAQTVKKMEPIVQGYQASRLKMAGAWALAVGIVGVLGWVAQALIDRLLHIWR